MLSCLAIGVALLSWPTSFRRLARPRRPWTGGLRTPAGSVWWWAVPLIGLTAVLISTALGPLVALAAALLAATVTMLVRSELRGRRDYRDLLEMLAALRTLAREVRSGAQPLAAIAASASAHHGRSGLVLDGIAVAVAGDRGQGPPETRPPTDLASEISTRLAAGWALSARYGVPWASLVDALTSDLADRARAKAQRAAQVSGPRVSGYVLALMPGLGLVLGVGMGADPVHVLLRTGAGHLMLLIGCSLTCAGLAWTARIVRG